MHKPLLNWESHDKEKDEREEGRGSPNLVAFTLHEIVGEKTRSVMEFLIDKFAENDRYRLLFCMNNKCISYD